MRVHALDPGPEQSALVGLSGTRIDIYHLLPNPDLREVLRIRYAWSPSVLVIEQFASMGMGVGQETFDACCWSGRFAELWEGMGGTSVFIPRRTVKLTLCESPKATDSNIRTRLVDLYGPGKLHAIGSKKAPGPLYGLKADLWQALALGLTYQIREGLDVEHGCR